jgi:hypothetical protein
MRWTPSSKTLHAIDATSRDDLCDQLMRLAQSRGLHLEYEAMTDQVDVYRIERTGRRRKVATYMPD